MGIEIEKKYRLSPESMEALRARLENVSTASLGQVFEENTIYDGPGLDRGRRVLRLRRVGECALLTFKERYSSVSPIKHQREEETEVSDPDALAAILEAVGYRPVLVYEKRRTTWRVAGTLVALDELPFGQFVEIEGEVEAIIEAENVLSLGDVESEHAPYPELTQRYGAERDGVIEARF